MPPDESNQDSEPRPFATFLMEHAKGRSHDELSQLLRDLVLAVEETGKPAKLTYTVSIKPQPKVDGAVLIADDIKTTVPKLDRPQSIFFATAVGDLVRNDPRQTNLFDEEHSHR